MKKLIQQRIKEYEERLQFALKVLETAAKKLRKKPPADDCRYRLDWGKELESAFKSFQFYTSLIDGLSSLLDEIEFKEKQKAVKGTAVLVR